MKLYSASRICGSLVDAFFGKLGCVLGCMSGGRIGIAGPLSKGGGGRGVVRGIAKSDVMCKRRRIYLWEVVWIW